MYYTYKVGIQKFLHFNRFYGDKQSITQIR